ncbi:TRAP transporter substrate-binding protein [Tepidibacillus fermentans]|uniref:Tripartite ATP-independent transporter DctP family solute receptor n=1 Tax=Tepidibacillus fermentans TaxID=1281767 RepID=A0A4V2URY7_9BACI|nr:TRAP transporter substrate-binding protein [Tepidibacillus fermentans]TCS79392.1 tripartite ATP-independent transporter DctP family solute receptor [Tepidibacillus fermentans]
MKLKKLFLFGLIAVLMLTSVACSQGTNDTQATSKDGVTKIKIANYFAEDHPQNVALREKFKKIVEEKTNGKVVVEIYPSNQLGDEAQFTNGVRNGTVEMAITGMGLQTANPKIGAVEWPFLFESYDHARKALNGEVGDEIETEFRKLGVEPLAWTVNGFRVISANRPIKSMDDFKGFRLRMPNIPIFVNTGKALGANVQPLPLSEVFTALEQKVIDGQENPYATLKASGFYEVQKYVLESNHMFSPNVYLMNKKLFDSFDKETQQIIKEAAQESANYEWELLLKSEEDVKKFLKEKGLEIIVPDAQFKEQMVKAMDPVYQDLYKQYDWAKAFVEKVRNSK